MGTVPVTIDGVFLPKTKTATDVPKPGVFVGQLSITGLGVGGGPVIPPDAPPVPPGQPGSPTFPIWGPPGIDFPDVPGYPPVAGHPLPPIPDPPPDMEKPPLFVPIWHPDFGWIVLPAFPIPTPSKRR
jgi:hypothetical protein